MDIDWRSFAFGIVATLGVFALPSFSEHFLYLMTPQINEIAIQQRWDLVALNIIGFLLFLLPLQYRRKADWKHLGVYSAFIVSLFVEMYGVPLAVFLSTPALGSAIPEPAYVLSFTLLNQTFGLSAWMLFGVVVTLVGMALVALGWYTIYKNRDGLVTTGIYSYSRHPQYAGIMLIALGWFIGWPTPLTAVILPILIYVYYRTAKEEEEEAMEEFGEDKYQEYRESTPFLI
jgi:protein-S-isoprenylcysteine O-methyltransferase Ste14